jgi:dTDP-4-amino-4,6-dideoxygalactose transaminase
MEGKMFSRFIGSPVAGFRETLAMSSREATELKDFWSVLGGKYVRAFEAEFAEKHRISYAVSMNSATSCLTAALIALGVEPGDEIVTTPFSFTATATAVALMGARAVFADVCPETYCMELPSLKAVVTDQTKAVMPAHILGNAGHITEIRDYCRWKGIALVEDTAQALHSQKDGEFLGSFGDIGIFSFQETKNIMTGEGGMAVTNDPELAYRLRLIRNHGEALVDEFDPPERLKTAMGYNFRLPEILAAIGYAQTQNIEFLNNIRKHNFHVLKRGLNGFSYLEFQKVTNDPGEFYPYCVGLRFNPDDFGVHRDLFALALRAEGVPVSTGFPRLLNENLIHDAKNVTPHANRLNYEEYLGFFQVGYPNTEEDMRELIAAVRKLTDSRDELIRAQKTLKVTREYDSGRAV